MKQPPRKGGKRKKNAPTSSQRNKPDQVGLFNKQPEKIIDETVPSNQDLIKEPPATNPQEQKKQEAQSESSSFMSDFDD